MGRRSVVWRHYTDVEKGAAICMHCKLQLSYRSSVSNLAKHLQRKHPQICLREESSEEEEEDFLPRDLSAQYRKYFTATAKPDLAHCRLCDEDVVGGKEELTQHVIQNHASDLPETDDASDESPIWQHFTRHPRTQQATCNVCKCLVSYRNGLYFIRRHLRLKHPHLQQDTDLKTIIISSNGELYEVETGKDDDDNQADPMDTVYLDEYVDIAKQHDKKKEQLGKRHSSVQVKNKENEKKRKIVQESDTDNCSTNENYENDKDTIENSLNSFTKYLVSFMKDLPKRVSDKLQVDMLKLVLDAKLANDALKNVDYKLTVLNSDTDTALTVTVSDTQGSSGIENMQNGEIEQ